MFQGFFRQICELHDFLLVGAHYSLSDALIMINLSYYLVVALVYDYTGSHFYCNIAKKEQHKTRDGKIGRFFLQEGYRTGIMDQRYH